MSLAQASELVQTTEHLIDKASVASDRWLFLVALTLLLAFAGAVIWWLVKRQDTIDVTHSKEREQMRLAHAVERDQLRDAALAERKDLRAELERERAEFQSIINTYQTKLDGLTEATRKTAEILAKHDIDMRAAHKLEVKELVELELHRQGLSAKLKKGDLE